MYILFILYIYDIIGFLMFFHQIISRNDDLVQFSPRSSAARYVRRVRPGARPAPRQCCRRPQRPGPNPPRPLPRPAMACPEQRSCRNLIAVCSLAMITLYTQFKSNHSCLANTDTPFKPGPPNIPGRQPCFACQRSSPSAHNPSCFRSASEPAATCPRT